MRAAARHVFIGLMVTPCVMLFLKLYFRSSENSMSRASTDVIAGIPGGVRVGRPGQYALHDNLTMSATSKQEHVSNTRKCRGKEKNRVFALVKVPKTGSSTLYTIFMRFALAHRLNIILTKKGVLLDLTRERGEFWDIGPESQSRADVVFNHVTYNERRFQKYLKPNYKMIFSVREQVSWFKSAVKYCYKSGTTTEMSPERLLMNDKWKKFRRVLHLKQLRFLGFNLKNSNNLIKIKEYLSYAVPKIDIPVLNDKFDASLVMLRRRFCWDYTDIFYQMSTVTNSSSMELSEEAVEKLLSAEFNKGDQLLYKAVEKLWWEQPEVKEQDFWDEVSYFTSLNKRVATEWCSIVSRDQQPHVIHSTQFHDEIQLTVEFCRKLKIDKNDLFQCVANYALGTKVSKTIAC